MNRTNTLSFVIVGHVDHGKSTLIGRLLYDTNSLPPDKITEMQKISSELGRETKFAYLLDHLSEERKQGITIDTTQVFFQTKKRPYVIIDAPGHVEFVKNMITGAAQAEAAVLIVDVAEGVREQTKRHSYMLSMLGLKQVIVALNKMDLVGYEQARFEAVKTDVQYWLESIGIAPLMYMPIAAIHGENIATRSSKLAWYEGMTFLDSLDTLSNNLSSDQHSLFFPIQDVYKVSDKRINVGRIAAGALTVGDAVRILPGEQKTHVKSIEMFLQHTTHAQAGDCIGMVTDDAVFLERGNIVCKEEDNNAPLVTNRFCANIFWMSRAPLKKGVQYLLRCSTQEVSCRIEEIRSRIDSSSLAVLETGGCTVNSLETAEVCIATKKPIMITDFNDVQEFGRFVFVQDHNICGGGIITLTDRQEQT